MPTTRLRTLVPVLLLMLAGTGARAQSSLQSRVAELQKQGKVDEALSMLRAAVTTSPDDAALRNMLGALLNRGGYYAEALAHAEAAAELEPGNVRYRLNRGIVRVEHGRFTDAISDFDSALERDPTLTYGYLERGSALLSLDRDAEARAQYQLARASDPSLVWPDWYEAIDDFVNQRYRDAAARFDRVGEREPAFGPAAIWRGLARARAGMAPPVIAKPGDDWHGQLHRYYSGALSWEALMTVAMGDRVSGDARRIGEAWFVAAERSFVAGQHRDAIAAYRNAVAVKAPRHAWKIAAERALRRLELPGADNQAPALFSFHSNAWLNLHHFLRAAARGRPAPAGLADDEARLWAEAVAFYKPYAARDLLFDQGMVDIKQALRGAEGAASLDGIAIDAGLRSTLERLMPLYLKHVWPMNDRDNRAWIAAAQPLVDRHGAAISQAMVRVYDSTWAGSHVPVDLTMTAGAVGAYTSENPTHVTIASTDKGYQGYAALEMLFHEASHSSISNLYPRVTEAAAQQKVDVPRQLWHGVLFYTAGELTVRELRAHGIAYTPYADEQLYVNLCGAGCREKIAQHWTPRLDGQRSLTDALAALVGAFK